MNVNSEIYKFKVKNSEINGAPLYGYVYHFLVDYDSTDIADILDIHKYLMKKHD